MSSYSRRPSRTDGDTTRAKILETAGKLFAENGYAATTSKEICVAAEVNLAAINYHFGSRDGLYCAVLSEGHKYLIDHEYLLALVQSTQTPRDKLAAFIEQMLKNLFDEQSWHARVCAREILAPSIHFAHLMNAEALPKFEILAGILSEVTHIPKGNPALLRCVISVVAPCLTMFMVSRDVASPMQELFKHSASDLATHFKTFALAGLEAISQTIAPVHK